MGSGMGGNEVRDNFAAAADRYSGGGEVHRLAASRLAAMLRPRPGLKWLDMGCGTAGLERQLGLTATAELAIFADIAEPMLHRARRRFSRARYVACDGERPPFACNSFDLITCSMAAQWFRRRRSLPNLLRLLKKGGRLGLALPLADSLEQWRRLSAQLGLEDGSLPLPDRRQLARIFTPLAMDDFALEQEFASPLDFLRQLKLWGAHAPQPGYKPQNLSALRRRHKFAIRWRIVCMVVGNG